MDDNRIAERDEQGKIKAMYLSSDAARKMVSMRRTKEDKAQDGTQAILSELGFTDDNPAPALVANLAQIAVSQKTGAVSAIGTLLRIAHGAGETGIVQVREGEKCPTCGMLYPGIGADLAREIVLSIQARTQKV
jgi:hypothetical protein